MSKTHPAVAAAHAEYHATLNAERNGTATTADVNRAAGKLGKVTDAHRANSGMDGVGGSTGADGFGGGITRG